MKPRMHGRVVWAWGRGGCGAACAGLLALGGLLAAVCAQTSPAPATPLAPEEVLRWERARSVDVAGDPLGVLAELSSVWEQGRGTPAQRRDLQRLLADACTRAGDAERALKILSENPGDEGQVSDAGALDLVRGRALLRAGRAEEAWGAFERAARAGADPVACDLGRASFFLEAGQFADALRVLETALQRRPEREFDLCAALGSLHLDLGNRDEAGRAIARMKPHTDAERAVWELSQSRLGCLEGRFLEVEPRLVQWVEASGFVAWEVRCGALLALVREWARAGRRGDAIRALGQVLQKEWAAPWIPALWRMWEDWLAPLDGAAEAEIKRLKQVHNPDVAAWAALFLGRIYWSEGRAEAAGGEWDVLVRENPRHPAAARVWAHRAEKAASEGRWEAAAECALQGIGVNAGGGIEGYLYMRLGEARFESGDFGGALNAFETAWRVGARGSDEAAFNAGLSAVRLGVSRKAGPWVERLRRSPTGRARGNRLELEMALAQGREDAPGAEEMLGGLIKRPEFAAERSLLLGALAEWSVRRVVGLVGSAPDAETRREASARGSARRHVDAFAQNPGDAADVAAALRVALEASDPDNAPDAVQALGEAFLGGYPASSRGAEVAFCLGENLYRAGRYADAEERFLTSARLAGDGGLRERALYGAGQCAAHSQGGEATSRALVHWDAVAQMGGKLRWRARYQQASLKCHLGDEREGILLYELILKSAPEMEPALLFAARCGRADALLSLARRSRSPAVDAVAEYRSLAVAAKDVPLWRNQALYKAAKAEEEVSPAAALQNLRDLVDSPASVRGEDEFWIFRAGFDAARILEAQKQWTEAVRIYEKLSRRKGPRAQEAATRAHQLRLENFLWKE